jgi:hypothetical protein
VSLFVGMGTWREGKLGNLREVRFAGFGGVVRLERGGRGGSKACMCRVKTSG